MLENVAISITLSHNEHNVRTLRNYVHNYIIQRQVLCFGFRNNKKPEILLRYFLLICCCVRLHIHAFWFFLSWYRTPHSFDYCVSCLLPYRHDGMGRKKVSVVLEIESYNKRSCGGIASQTSDGFFPLGEYLQSKG